MMPNFNLSNLNALRGMQNGGMPVGRPAPYRPVGAPVLGGGGVPGGGIPPTPYPLSPIGPAPINPVPVSGPIPYRPVGGGQGAPPVGAPAQPVGTGQDPRLMQDGQGFDPQSLQNLMQLRQMMMPQQGY